MRCSKLQISINFTSEHPPKFWSLTLKQSCPSLLIIFVTSRGRFSSVLNFMQWIGAILQPALSQFGLHNLDKHRCLNCAKRDNSSKSYLLFHLLQGCQELPKLEFLYLWYTPCHDKCWGQLLYDFPNSWVSPFLKVSNIKIFTPIIVPCLWRNMAFCFSYQQKSTHHKQRTPIDISHAHSKAIMLC